MPGPPRPDDEIMRVRYQIGNRIRSLRVARDLSQERLAELVGVHRKTVNRAENGAYALSIDQCVRIARALKVPLIWLFGDDWRVLDGLPERVDDPSTVPPQDS